MEVNSVQLRITVCLFQFLVSKCISVSGSKLCSCFQGSILITLRLIALFSFIGHPWLAGHPHVKIPLDMIIYRQVKIYICSSSLRKSALCVSNTTLARLINFCIKYLSIEVWELNPLFNLYGALPIWQALAKTLTVPQLAYLKEQFNMMGPNKSGFISMQNFKMVGY